MDLRTYEITIITDPQLEDAQVEELTKKVENLITSKHGEILKKETWGKRKLAYQIKRRQYGLYVYLLFKSDNFVIDEIERQLKLDESVLRFLTVKLSESAMKQMESITDKGREEKTSSTEIQDREETEKEEIEEERNIE